MFQGKEIQMADFERLMVDEYGADVMQIICSNQTDDTNRVIRTRIQNDSGDEGH